MIVIMIFQVFRLRVYAIIECAGNPQLGCEKKHTMTEHNIKSSLNTSQTVTVDVSYACSCGSALCLSAQGGVRCPVHMWLGNYGARDITSERYTGLQLINDLQTNK